MGQLTFAFDFGTPRCSRCGVRVREDMTWGGGWLWRTVGRYGDVDGSTNCQDDRGLALQTLTLRLSRRGNWVRDPLAHWVEEVERLDGGVLAERIEDER